MDQLRILSFIALLPSLYPLQKIFKKNDLNVWDFILLFQTLFFCFIPLKINGYGAIQLATKLNPETTTYVFLILFLFNIIVMLYDIHWTIVKGRFSNSVINITKYIRESPTIMFSKCGYFLVYINIIISLVWYVPNTGSMLHMEDLGHKSYSESSMLMFYSNIFTLCFSLCTIKAFQEFANILKNKKLLICSICFVFLSLFLSRRNLTLNVLFVLLLYYSFFKESISLKKIMKYGIPIAIILNLYFTFYNVVRWSSVTFNTSAPIESTIAIFEDSIDKWDLESKNAENITEGRSVSLYSSLYALVQHDKSPSCGMLIVKSIDLAIPKIINPGKGSGIQKELEKRACAPADISDSIIYDAYGDAHIGAPILAFLIYFVVFRIYIRISNFFCRLNKKSVIPIFLTYIFFSIAWNIELDMPGLFCGIIQKIPFFIGLLLLSRLDIIKTNNIC